MKNYTDFLKNKKFVRWQLFPDDALNHYWEDFIHNNPHREKEIKKAIKYLKAEGLNKILLEEGERSQLLVKIQTTIRNRQNMKRRRVIWYSAASIALLLIGLTLFYPQRKSKVFTAEKEFIMGELMDSEEIQLVAGDKSISFQNDIDVKLNKEGRAEIIHHNEAKQEIKIEENQLNTLIIPYGKRSTLTLADGSKVWLNSGSILKFPAQFHGNSRRIYLSSGEMYIEVAPDKNMSFFVHTEKFNVKVYGTKFNVSAYSGSPQSVVLIEGSVSLQSEKCKDLFITPSEMATYSEDGIFETERVDIEHFISWKNGYLTFDKTAISEVLEQIGRYYNLSFNYEQDTNLQKRTCSGKIHLSDNLDNVMKTIGLLSSTVYTRADNQIFIAHKPF